MPRAAASVARIARSARARRLAASAPVGIEHGREPRDTIEQGLIAMRQVGQRLTATGERLLRGRVDRGGRRPHLARWLQISWRSAGASGLVATGSVPLIVSTPFIRWQLAQKRSNAIGWKPC